MRSKFVLKGPFKVFWYLRKIKDFYFYHRLILVHFQALSTEYQGGPQTFPEFATLNGTVIELGE